MLLKNRLEKKWKKNLMCKSAITENIKADKKEVSKSYEYFTLEENNAKQIIEN